jgi:protein involved in polysaccharide export with SLBB domain
MRTFLRATLLVCLIAYGADAQWPGGTAAGSDPAVARPGDVIRLSIWREPQLSGDFVVDETGTVVLPKIGPVIVNGETPVTLRARLTAAYGAYVNHTSIAVTLLRRVQVLGAVRNPGLYTADPTMTLSDVLAQAGGVTPHGNARTVQLIPRGGSPVAVSPHASVAQLPVRSGDQLFVPERSWFLRYPTLTAAALTAVTTISIALGRSR